MEIGPKPEALLVGRPTKSAAKSAEKPSIIFGQGSRRKNSLRMPAIHPPTCLPGIVLDTNVLLDWLVFGDPSCVGFSGAILAGQLRWLAAHPMREEWNDVLARGVGANRSPEVAALADIWSRHANILPAPASQAPGRPFDCRCTDPDDQIFIDLALSSGARWLLSRDRAVLKLARSARCRGLLILPPVRWSIDQRA